MNINGLCCHCHGGLSETKENFTCLQCHRISECPVTAFTLHNISEDLPYQHTSVGCVLARDLVHQYVGAFKLPDQIFHSVFQDVKSIRDTGVKHSPRGLHAAVLVKILWVTKTTFNLGDIAQFFSVSSKTIRKCLNLINCFPPDTFSDITSFGDHASYKFKIPYLVMRDIVDDCKKSVLSSSIDDKIRFCAHLAHALRYDQRIKNFTTLVDICVYFNVSKNTILNHLKKM